jgi:predicted DNA-binding transcriptional regulator AlpA
MVCHIAMQPDARWRMHQLDKRTDELSPLMTLDEVCRFFGGSAPLHPATVYRGIGVRYPRPVKIGPNSNRWLRAECEAALQALAERRVVSTAATELKSWPPTKRSKRRWRRPQANGLPSRRGDVAK